MRRSLNEVVGLVLKAGRGAGLPLGHAEDLAAAAMHLAATAPGDLGQVLTALTPPHIAPSLPDAGVVQGARIAMAGPMAIDRVIAEGCAVRLTRPDAPALMQALVAVAQLTQGAGLVLDIDGDGCVLRPAAVASPVLASYKAVIVDPKVWEGLEALAAHTLVPATAASRLTGAGAGIVDID